MISLDEKRRPSEKGKERKGKEKKNDRRWGDDDVIIVLELI